MIDRQTIHVHDSWQRLKTEYPERGRASKFPALAPYSSRRCYVKVIPIGTIRIRRTEVRPFTEKQIKLLKPSPTRP